MNNENSDIKATASKPKRKYYRPKSISKIFGLPDHITRKINNIIDRGGKWYLIRDIIKNDYKGKIKIGLFASSINDYITQYKQQRDNPTFYPQSANNTQVMPPNYNVDQELNNIEKQIENQIITTNNQTPSLSNTSTLPVKQAIKNIIDKYESKMTWINNKPNYELNPNYLSIYDKCLSGQMKCLELLNKIEGNSKISNDDIDVQIKDRMYDIYKMILQAIKEVYGTDRHELFMAKLENIYRNSSPNLVIPKEQQYTMIEQEKNIP